MIATRLRHFGISLVAAWGLVVGATSCAEAAPAANRVPHAQRIAVVNMNEIYRNSPLAVKAIKKLEKEFAGREQELQRLARQLRELQSSLEKDAGSSSEVERRGRERDLASISRTFQHLQQKFRQDYNVRRNEENAVLQDRIKRAIIEVAQREQLDVVLSEGVFYARNHFDITDKIIRQMGER